MADEVDKFHTNKVAEWLGKRSNIFGVGFGFFGLAGGFEALHRPILAIPLGVAAYAAGFLIGNDWRKDVSLKFADRGDRVEVAAIQRNIRDLRNQVEPYRVRLPKDIINRLDAVFDLLTEILPQWAKLHGFTEQKYTVNEIVTAYLPTILANYLNLPASLYHASSKKQFQEEIVAQLDLMITTLTSVRDSIVKGMEANIAIQGTFLKSKFADGENKLLRLP